MLKIAARTGLILLVAGIVCGGMYFLVDAGMVSSLPGGEIADRPAMGAEAQTSGTDRPARPEFSGEGRPEGGHGQEGGSLMAAGGIFLNLAKVSLITLAVVLAQWLISRWNRRRAITPAS